MSQNTKCVSPFNFKEYISMNSADFVIFPKQDFLRLI